MGEAVYRIEALRDKVVALLRQRRAPMTAGAITVALELPFWAVQAGLESAMAGGLVYFCTQGYLVQNMPLANANDGQEAIKCIAVEGVL